MEIARLICANAPLGVQVTKAGALTYIEAGERAAIDFGKQIRAKVMNTDDAREGLAAFLGKRKPRWVVEFEAESAGDDQGQ